MRKRFLKSIFAGCFIISLSGCAADKAVDKQDVHSRLRHVKNNQYAVVKTDDRANNRADYFHEERKMLKKRRELNGLPEPKYDGDRKDIAGLAFSGGGIRSHAFQLGFMSGLSKVGFLKKVDYVSAVSGGSWAAGAYKSTSKEDGEFFGHLDSAVTIKDDLEANDKRTRPLFNSYQGAVRDIWTETTDWLHLHVGSRTQEKWRKMLYTNVLDNKDIELKSLDDDRRAKRPFIIFNTTHDANMYTQGEKKDYNFPFEITSNFIGTVADCKNTKDYCSDWDKLSYGHCEGIFTSPEHPELASLTLSYAMAMSGAVVPHRYGPLKLNMLDWKLNIPQMEPKQEKHRSIMVITDGGQSDNLGVLALMERHVPRIIVSDIAHDTEKKDLEDIKHHSTQLLHMIIKDSEHKWANPKHADETSIYYYCLINSTECREDSTAMIGKILYLKPSQYKRGFRKYLSQSGASHIKTYLDINKEHLSFPTDKTFATLYEYNLIFSYYLLGRYFAVEVLEPELVKTQGWHERDLGQGPVLRVEDAYTVPPTLLPGNTVEMKIIYAILTPAKTDLEVTEKREIRLNGALVNDPEKDVVRAVRKVGITNISGKPFTLPQDAERGLYVVTTTIQSGNLSDQIQSAFTVR